MDPIQNGAPQQSVPPTPSSDRSIGPAVGVIIIIIIVLLGGLYFWGQRVDQEQTLDAEMTEKQLEAEAEIEAMRTQGTSDDLNSIEADLNSTNTDNLGSEMDDMEAESSGSAEL